MARLWRGMGFPPRSMLYQSELTAFRPVIGRSRIFSAAVDVEIVVTIIMFLSFQPFLLVCLKFCYIYHRNLGPRLHICANERADSKLLTISKVKLCVGISEQEYYRNTVNCLLQELKRLLLLLKYTISAKESRWHLLVSHA